MTKVKPPFFLSTPSDISVVVSERWNEAPAPRPLVLDDDELYGDVLETYVDDHQGDIDWLDAPE